MQSFEKAAKRFLERASMKRNRKGQAVNIAIGTILSLILGFVTVMLYLFLVATLNVPSLFTASSYEANQTALIQRNLTSLATESAGRFTTLGVMLGVLILVGVVAFAIFFLRRSAGNAGGNATV